MWTPHLSEFESSLLPIAVILGVWLLVPVLVDRTKTLHRAALFSVATVLALRYGWWRATETLAPFGFTVDCLASWSFFALEALTLVSSVSSFVMMSRTKDRSEEATAHQGWYERDGPMPRVALLIATYNEELEVLERSILGAKSLRHPNKEVLVLDDGRRDWLRDYCATQGVRYVTRPDNKGSKAGNINHALDRLAEDPVQPDFIAVLDADFVAHRGFLSRSLALFKDPKIALVQTPQHFFNADPIQNNLGLSTSYPDEQRYFFDYVQPSRDAWGIAICCGTSSIMRWDAIREIGGFSTDSVTEDFLLSLIFSQRGWSVAYLNEALTEGLAPEGLKEYVGQRARWCLGLMQIMRGPWGPFSRRKMRIRDRWSVAESANYWLTSFSFRIAALIFPLLYWYFNIIVVNADVPSVILYFAPYYAWSMMISRTLFPGMVVPIIQETAQLLAAIPVSRAAIVGAIRPKGHPFSVTAKGGDRSRIVVQWGIMRPFLILLILTIGGLLIGSVSDRFAFNDAGDGKRVVLFWTIYNLIVLSFLVMCCVELPRRERHVADEPRRARLIRPGQRDVLVWLASLSSKSAVIRGVAMAKGDTATLQIDGVGDVPCEIERVRDGSARATLHMDAAQRESLLLQLYATDNVPGVSTTRTPALLKDMATRLSKIPLWRGS